MRNENENIVSTNANLTHAILRHSNLDQIDSSPILNSTLNQDNESNIQTVDNSCLTNSTPTRTGQEKRISYSHLSSTQLTSLLSPSLSSSLNTLNEGSKLSMANLLECLNTFGLDLYKRLAARSQKSINYFDFIRFISKK
jgi:hypothetical protein